MRYFLQKSSLILLLFMAWGMSACVKNKRLPQQTDAVQKQIQAPKAQRGEAADKKERTQAETPRSEIPAPEISARDLPKDPRLDAVMHQFQKGIRFLEQDKTQKAKTLFETLRDDYPGVSVFYLNLGVAYKRLGRLEEAMHAYRQAISIAERSPGGGYAEAYYNLGIVLREQGRFKDAEAAYLRAIAVDPDFQDAYFNLAVLYDLYLNEPVKAIRHYRKHMRLKAGPDEEIGIWIAALEKRIKAKEGQP